MTYESRISNIIVKLKEVRNHHPEYTLQRISDHTGVSMSTVTRIFASGSENQSFRYDSIRPIAQMLLGIDNLDEGEDDEKALKAIIQFKDTRIKELEAALNEEKAKHERKLEKERAQSRTSIDFLKHQVDLKDARIDSLMGSVKELQAQFQDLHKQFTELTSKLLANK